MLCDDEICNVVDCEYLGVFGVVGFFVCYLYIECLFMIVNFEIDLLVIVCMVVCYGFGKDFVYFW